MKRAACAPADAYGAILAEPVAAAGRKLPKGRSIGKEELALLNEAGIESIDVIRIGLNDIVESAAADAVAEGAAGSGTKTLPARQGLAAITATQAGMLRYDADRLAACNLQAQSFLVAALPPLAAVQAGIAVATVKAIPLVASRADTAAATELAPRFEVAQFAAKRVALLQTHQPTTKPSLLDKAASVAAARLAPLGSELACELRCAHDCASVASCLAKLADCDLILAIGIHSANSAEDPLPAALLAAGGSVLNFGLPFEPGHLTIVGKLDQAYVLIMPGSARSPKRGSYDVLLEWLHAGIDPTPELVAAMGRGGLHREPSAGIGAKRKLPRRIAGVLLAAGQSQRMGDANKLTEPYRGKPLVRHAGETLAQAAAAGVVHSTMAVLGHERESVTEALEGLDLACAFNPDHATGMASSLQTALRALPADTEAVAVLLGDMPDVQVDDIKAAVAAFDPAANRTLVAACHRGKRGNPVVVGAQHFAELRAGSGDVGARSLFARYPVAEAEAGPGVLRDIDSPADW